MLLSSAVAVCDALYAYMEAVAGSRYRCSHRIPTDTRGGNQVGEFTV